MSTSAESEWEQPALGSTRSSRRAAGRSKHRPGPLPASPPHALPSSPPPTARPIMPSSSRPALGIVEAKKLTLGPQNVLIQAERYARGVNDSPFDFGGFRVPFLYSTNGEVIWFHDVRHPLNRSRRIAAFHTPAPYRNCSPATSTPPAKLARDANHYPLLRPYTGRPTPRSKRPLPTASGKCSSRWPPAPARPSRW